VADQLEGVAFGILEEEGTRTHHREAQGARVQAQLLEAQALGLVVGKGNLESQVVEGRARRVDALVGVAGEDVPAGIDRGEELGWRPLRPRGVSESRMVKNTMVGSVSGKWPWCSNPITCS
jgi:hypothetical protein